MNKYNIVLIGILIAFLSIVILYSSNIQNNRRLLNELELIRSMLEDIDHDIHELLD